MELGDKCVLVTGGARRIGRALCLSLAQRGARVAIHHGSSGTEAREVSARCEGSVVLQADLRRVAECERLVEEARERLGGVDVLVNNAAVFVRTPLEDVDEESWDLHLETNLKGPFFCARAAGLAMREAGGGVIVNLTDWGIDRPYVDYLPYFAAKAGLASLTAGLARALAPTVRVNAVAPGPILLPEGADEAYARRVEAAGLLGRLGGEESIVDTVMFLIGNDFVTGETVTVDGGRSLT